MRIHLYYIMCIAVCVALEGCQAYMLTEEDCFPTSHAVAVHVDVDSTMAVYKTVETRSDEYQLRFTVNAYHDGKVVANACSLEPDMSLVLPHGEVRLVAFVDYVLSSMVRDYYFFTDRFDEILVRDRVGYKPNTPSRMAFHGIVDCVVGDYTSEIDILTTAAMGQFRLVATDVPGFEVGKIEVTHDGLMPSAIDGRDGKVCVNWGDVYLASMPIGDLLVFDNVFAERDETLLTVTVKIFDTTGELRAITRGVTFPIVRGGITTVRLPFYSTFDREDPPPSPSTGGGLSIDPSFASTVVIEI